MAAWENPTFRDVLPYRTDLSEVHFRLLWRIQNRSADPALSKAKMQFRTHHTQRPAGWWFQPSWKIWVNLDHMPSWGENSKCTFDVVLIFKYQQLWTAWYHMFSGRCSAVSSFKVWMDFQNRSLRIWWIPASITSSLKNLQLKWARTNKNQRTSRGSMDGWCEPNHPHLVAHVARHLVREIREHDCHCSFAHH